MSEADRALVLDSRLRAEAERAARDEGLSIEAFVSQVLAERLAERRRAKRYEDLLSKADREIARRVLARGSDQPLPEGDELPPPRLVR